MTTILKICGFLLVFYAMVIFAAAMSIVSGSDIVRTARIYAFAVVGLYIVLGIYYVLTARAIKKRKFRRLLAASLVGLLTRYRFRLPLIEFALSNNIYLEEAEHFIRTNPVHFSGTLAIDKQGVIIYDYKKIL